MCMKAYGVPRLKGREYPDSADIRELAMPSRFGKSHNRKVTRRGFAKRARGEGRRAARAGSTAE